MLIQIKYVCLVIADQQHHPHPNKHITHTPGARSSWEHINIITYCVCVSFWVVDCVLWRRDGKIQTDRAARCKPIHARDGARNASVKYLSRGFDDMRKFIDTVKFRDSRDGSIVWRAKMINATILARGLCHPVKIEWSILSVQLITNTMTRNGRALEWNIESEKLGVSLKFRVCFQRIHIWMWISIESSMKKNNCLLILINWSIKELSSILYYYFIIVKMGCVGVYKHRK